MFKRWKSKKSLILFKRLKNKNKNCIVYTGSHDSDCTLTWCKNLDGDTLKRFEKECPRNHPSDVYNLIEFAFLSPANLAVIPLQDYLELENEEGRMNTPSTASGNWTWRVDPSYNNFDLIKKTYSTISKHYRCEYVYKNELIKLLLKEYGTRDTVYFSEFRVGNSIADMVMFNGESKAFEIKTEYDTPRRLDKQMEDYKRFFDKCYIVVPESKLDEYRTIVESTTGIISMKRDNGRIILYEVRQAQQNRRFDPDALMSCLRISEYTNITLSLGVSVDGIAGYDMFNFCYDVISNADSNLVKKLFLREVKKRKNNTSFLRKYPPVIRQMMLSLNLPEDKANKLISQYENKIINIHPSLIPSFCGEGYYGIHVHNAIFNKGVKVSGATTHFVSLEVDGGPIILQRAIDISSCNSPEEIQKLVLDNIEHQLLVDTVKLYCDNKLKIENGKVTII